MRSSWSFAAALALGFAAEAASAGRPHVSQIDIPAQPLEAAIAALARMTGTEMLYDPRVLAGRVAPPLHGRMDVDQALARLLGKSGLSARRTPDGAVLISKVRDDSSAPAPEDAGAIPEILVVGHRTLNVDIARSEDDIQPYRVIGAATIAQSSSETPDGFLKSRLATNAQGLLTTQAPVFNTGGTRSQVDLRGLGAAQTLILVDGHRLPSYPALDDFRQPNINGIPLGAIDRIETISSTAGGIYGPGATGGVVNIVLKRDARGIDLGLTRGISSRGDGPSWRFDGHLGYTSPSGATEISLYYSHREDAGLVEGDRSYVAAAREQRDKGAAGTGLAVLPASGFVNIFGYDDLTLSDRLGGGSIGSQFTYLPISAIGTPEEAAILRANAGKTSYALSPDGFGAEQNLVSRSRNDGLTFTATQHVSPDIEAFVDLVAFSSRGDATGPLEWHDGDGWPSGGAGSVGSPFSTDFTYTFPALGPDGQYRTKDRMVQATAGLIARLPADWRADVDLTGGLLGVRSTFPMIDILGKYPNIFDPADRASYIAQLEAYPYGRETISSRSYDATVRLAGPVVRLAGGPLTMTLLGEARGDRSSGIHWSTAQQAFRDRIPEDSPHQTQNIQSLYAELRAPLTPKDSGFALLRGLELQLAARGDRYSFSVPFGYPDLIATADDFELGPKGRLHRAYDMAALTAGARVEPLSGVMLRTSYATGYLPPQPVDLITQTVVGRTDFFYPGFDSKRGGSSAGNIDTILGSGGSPTLGLQRVRSVSAGIVLSPAFLTGVRFSADYTDIRIAHQISYAENSNLQFFLDHEDIYPGRVTRAPLTADDAAMGYTAGKVLAIDTSALGTGQARLRFLDLSLSADRTTSIGTFHLSGQMTWTPRFRERANAYEPWNELAGFLDGPVPVKANIALNWERGAFSLGGYIQYIGAYRAQYAQKEQDIFSDPILVNEIFAQEQGGTHIAPQAYVDLFATFRSQIGDRGRAILYRLSVHNVLDKAPPFYVPAVDQKFLGDFGTGYSYFGDPLGRYFRLSIEASF